MPSPQTLLPWLLGGAIGAAGILQGLHWRSTRTPTDLEGLENQLRIAGEENAMLQRENESLRSLAQGGGEFAVPPELIARAEKEIELRFKSTPMVHRIATEELRDRITASIESRYGPTGMDDRQESYQLIGWLRPGDDLLAQLTAVRSVGVRSWFDEVTGEGWVVDRLDLKNIPDQAALLRILVRTLLNQNFPPPPAYPGDDAARAHDALHQGAAAGAVARYLNTHAMTNGFIPMQVNSEAEQLLASLSPFIQGITTFPVTEGKGLTDRLYVAGNTKLHAVLRKPPQTTRALIYPAEPASDGQALDLPKVPEEPFLTETAGQLGLRLWLEPLGDVGLASEISSSWKNDRYVLFPDGETSSAVLWDIELDNVEDTDALERIGLNLVAAMAGQQDAATLGKAIVSPEKRHFQLTRISPTRIRFLNTAEAATVHLLGNR